MAGKRSESNKKSGESRKPKSVPVPEEAVLSDAEAEVNDNSAAAEETAEPAEETAESVAETAGSLAETDETASATEPGSGENAQGEDEKKLRDEDPEDDAEALPAPDGEPADMENDGSEDAHVNVSAPEEEKDQAAGPVAEAQPEAENEPAKADVQGPAETGKKVVRKKRREKFPFSTLLLLILFGVALFGLYKLVSKLNSDGKIMEGLKGRNVLGSQSTSGKSSGTEEYDDYREVSLALSKLNSTHKEWTNIDKNPGETGFSCIATENIGPRMVYNLDPSHICGNYTLRDFNYIWVDSVNSAFCCLINIPGEVVDLSDYYVLVHDDTGNLASRLVINCYEAKVLKLNHAIISGTVLAPDANVEYESTVIYGAVYAKASTGTRGYYKHIAFTGYAEIMKESSKFEFVNIVVRSKAYAWLREHFPSVYSTYPDDYVMNLDDLANITDLDFEGDYIADMYDDLSAMVNLESLSLRKTKLKSLDLSAQKNLKYLDISDTDIETIILPETDTIIEFNAANAKLSSLDTAPLGKAETVLLRNNPFKKGRPAYEKLRSVETLDITNTGANNDTMKKLYTLKNLKHLEASENSGITSVDFSKLTGVEYAEFMDCSIAEAVFDGAEKLAFVDLSYNSMKSVDAGSAPALTLINAYGDYKTVTVRNKDVEVKCLDTTKIKYAEEN